MKTAKSQRIRSIVFIGLLTVLTAGAMVVFGSGNTPAPCAPHQPLTVAAAQDGLVSVNARLVQNKILKNSDGVVNLALTLQAEVPAAATGETGHGVDLVVVLDRSGSMQGLKIEHARQAVRNLLADLAPEDRFALVSYADQAQAHTDLLPVTDGRRLQFDEAVQGIRPGGGTNLGAGLQKGMDLLAGSAPDGNVRQIILISDGLANKGITDPTRLGILASRAVTHEFAVSTVGLGAEFNEQLMTAIADQGTGTYYYLENPAAFGEVFRAEFRGARTLAAAGLEVRVPLSDGLQLTDAGGYPVRTEGTTAVFYPGNLRFGQSRKIFLTLRVPSAALRTFELRDIAVRYRAEGRLVALHLADTLDIACVPDPRAVMESIDKERWAHKVLKNDYSRLKDEVAGDIRAGKKQDALQRIERYYRKQETVNRVMASPAVRENLEKDLGELRGVVEDTFRGSPGAVVHKQKTSAKALQYEGYQGQRGNP